MLTEIKQEMLLSEDAYCTHKYDHVFDSIIYLQAEVEKLPGDIVEAGVWRGIMTTFMAKAFPNKIVWACDSFEGCPSDIENLNYIREIDLKWWAGELKAEEQYLLDNMKRYDASNIKILKGWFNKTLSTLKVPIALLRIDCDLYSSTREVLEALYPQVVVGGYIIFDDFIIHTAREAIFDYFGNNVPTLYHPITHEQLPKIVMDQSQTEEWFRYQAVEVWFRSLKWLDKEHWLDKPWARDSQGVYMKKLA
jgi:hypothetical protein